MADELLVIVALLGIGLVGAGWFAHRLNLPPALGYLAVGMVLAPSVELTPDLPVDAIETASHFGVLFVLFFIGLELDLRTLRKVMRDTASVSLFNILVPAAVVFAIGQSLGWGLAEALVLGLAVSMSSTIFGERLSALPGFPRAGRQRNLGILVGEDVAAGLILGLMAVVGTSQGFDLALPVGRLFFLLVLAAAGALLIVPRLLDAAARTHIPELLVLSGLVIILVFGFVGDYIGSGELGAFLAGMAAAEAGSRFVIRNTLVPLRDLGLAVFFLAAGLHVDARSILDHALPIVAIAAAFLLTKAMVHVPASLAAGMSFPDSLRTALGLSAIGEFSLILAAAAAGHGLAHPLLRTYIVGVMLVLLFVAPLMLNGVDPIVRRLNRMPKRFVRPMSWVVQGLSRPPAQASEPTGERRTAGRILAANAILLVAWILLSYYGGPYVSDRLPLDDRFAGTAVIGLSLALGAPLVYFSYRAYRDVVRSLVGLEGEGDGASRVRARIVDAWVALTGLVLLLPITLLLPSAVPVLLGGALVALIILIVAWRGLSRFHRALEGSITRVLGHDAQADALLDQVLRNYPWGVRFAAVTVGPDSSLAGSTLKASRVHELTECIIAVLQRGRQEIVNPGPDQDIKAGDTLVLMGDATELAKAEALVIAHGEALRTQVQSRLAKVIEVPVHATSLLRGRTLGFADLRTTTGAIVVGVWPHGALHPKPFAPDIVVEAEDHLILLGTPLQVERARLLAGEPSAAHPA